MVTLCFKVYNVTYMLFNRKDNFCQSQFFKSNSYTMGCLPVRVDNPRALASGLSYVQADKHGITILYHLHL